MSPVVESRNNYRFIKNMNSPAPLKTAIKITQVDLQKKVNLTQYDEKASDHKSIQNLPQMAYQNSLTKNPEEPQ
jgi:hypothetical protein